MMINVKSHCDSQVVKLQPTITGDGQYASTNAISTICIVTSSDLNGWWNRIVIRPVSCHTGDSYVIICVAPKEHMNNISTNLLVEREYYGDSLRDYGNFVPCKNREIR